MSLTCMMTVMQVGILAEALGGVNVGNCGHACEARPCGDAECRPLRERFTCRCHPGMPHPCPAPAFIHQQLQTDHRHRLVDPSNDISLPMNINRSTDSSSSNNQQPLQFGILGIPSFSGRESYLHYDDADTMKRFVN